VGTARRRCRHPSAVFGKANGSRDPPELLRLGRGRRFAFYCPATDRCYFVAMAEIPGRRQLRLRVNSTRNNQASGIRWAKDYEFAAKLIPVLGP
jgi:hypothetical protein